MGQVCSCGSAPKEGGEVVHKPQAPARIVVGAPDFRSSTDGAQQQEAASAGTGEQRQEAVEAMQKIVKQAMNVSRGDLGAALEETEEDWHDALDDLRLEEVLSKWDQDQQATLERLDRALQMLQAKGLQELSARRAAEAAQTAAAGQAAQPPAVSPKERGAATASGAALHEPDSMTPRQQSLELIMQGVNAIFSTLHAPMVGSREEALVVRAKAAVDDSRPLAAEALLKELCSSMGISMEQLAEQSEMLGIDVPQVEEHANLVRRALEELADDRGWMVSRDDSLRVLYRHEKGGTRHSLKFRAVLDHPLEHILAIVNEFDLITTWNKFALDSLKLYQDSIFSCIVYVAQWMPRPFKHFYVLMAARGFDLGEETRSLMVTMGDIGLGSLPPGSEPLPAATAKRRRCDTLPGSCINLRPLPAGPNGKPRTEGHLIVHVDPHIPLIPPFIVNFVLGVLAPYVFNQLCEVLTKCFSDPEGVYPSRIQAQPELYGRLRQRVAEFAGELDYGYGGSAPARRTSAPVAPAAVAAAFAAALPMANGAGGQASGGGRGAAVVGKEGERPVAQQQLQEQAAKKRTLQQEQQQAQNLNILDTFDHYDFHDALEHEHDFS